MPIKLRVSETQLQQMQAPVPGAQKPQGRSERDIQREILQVIGARSDLYLWRSATGGGVAESGKRVRFGVPGQSDLMGVIRRPCYCQTCDGLPEEPEHAVGVMLCIEVKAERYKPGPTLTRTEQAQQRFGEAVTRMGGVYIVARSVEDVEAVIGPAR